MKYDITLPLPAGWTSELDCYEELDGSMITHLECNLPVGNEDFEAFLDIYVGAMPADTTAEDQAYANFAEIIGWSDEDEEESPIVEWRFKGKRSFGFSGECEDGSIMLVITTEILKGALLLCTVIAKTDDDVAKWVQYLDQNLKIKANK